MSSSATRREEVPRLYRDLANWYSLLTPVGDYAEKAAFYRRLFEAINVIVTKTL